MKTTHFLLFTIAILGTLTGCQSKETTENPADDLKSAKNAKLSLLGQYSADEQWDKIIAECAADGNNALFISFRNMAMARKGVLADQLFRYPQNTSAGLIPGWNSAPEVSALLSDIYFAQGDIANAQHMAFESLVVTNELQIKLQTEENPAMLKRLIQSNLINGAHLVAEKYMKVLENMEGNEEWCKRYKPFIHNDAKVAADPLLGEKRKCIPQQDYFLQQDTLDNELMGIAKANPKHQTAIQYAGCIYLLDKRLQKFRQLIETNYNTSLLPTLPRSFQEGVIAIAEADTAYWHRYGVESETVDRFNQYKQLLIANNRNPNISNVMRQRFGDTFWYYLMFKQ